MAGGAEKLVMVVKVESQLRVGCEKRPLEWLASALWLLPLRYVVQDTSRPRRVGWFSRCLRGVVGALLIFGSLSRP